MMIFLQLRIYHLRSEITCNPISPVHFRFALKSMCDTRPSSINMDPSTIPRKSSPGIAINAPVTPSDGFSSPRDCAHTPPGVVTKIETKMYKNSSPSAATYLKCCICQKDRENLICKMCTKEKLKFYSRKESLVKKQQIKAQLADEIEAIAGERSSISFELNRTSDKIDELTKLIEEKRKSNKARANEIERLRKKEKEFIRFKQEMEKFFDKLEDAEKYRKVRYTNKQKELKNKKQELTAVRQRIALEVSGIFPVAEVIAESTPSRPSTKWAIINPTDPIPVLGHLFQIREMACPDESGLDKLAVGLSQSSLDLSNELRPFFASLLLTVELINLLAHIMDYRLPLGIQIPLKKLTLHDRWTKTFLTDEWHKICTCIFSLGLRIGMSPTTLHFHCPHSNLIEIGQFILNGHMYETLQPLGEVCNYNDIDSPTTHVAEKDLPDSSWDVIDCQDF